MKPTRTGLKAEKSGGNQLWVISGFKKTQDQSPLLGPGGSLKAICYRGRHFGALPPTPHRRQDHLHCCLMACACPTTGGGGQCGGEELRLWGWTAKVTPQTLLFLDVCSYANRPLPAPGFSAEEMRGTRCHTTFVPRGEGAGCLAQSQAHTGQPRVLPTAIVSLSFARSLS